jgi:hypothetical protein
MRSRVGKSTIVVPLAIYLCMTLFSCKPKPFTKTLEEEVRDALDLKKFDKSKVDDRAVVLVASRNGRHFFTRDDMENFIAHTRAKGEIYEASDFKVLNKNESDNSSFASITYEVTWKISLDNRTRSTHVAAQEIWERQIDGWHRLFAAIDSTTAPEQGVEKAPPQTISASSDQTGQHAGLVAITAPAKVTCASATSDIPNPQPIPSCNIVTPGYGGDVKVGATIGANNAGTVTLTCNGQGNKLNCTARIQ